MTERSSGTRYSRKNSGGTPPSKPYPLSQQLPDRGSEASKCRPTRLIPPPSVSDPQTEEAKLPSVVRQSKFPLPRQRPADRGSEASKCRPTKQIPPPSVSNSQTEEAKLPNVVRPTLQKKNSLSQSPKKEGPAMITIKFNGKPTQIPTSTPITTFLTTHNYNPIHVVVELNEVIIPKESYPTTTLSPDDTLEILTFMGGGQ